MKGDYSKKKLQMAEINRSDSEDNSENYLEVDKKAGGH